MKMEIFILLQYEGVYNVSININNSLYLYFRNVSPSLGSDCSNFNTLCMRTNMKSKAEIQMEVINQKKAELEKMNSRLREAVELVRLYEKAVIMEQDKLIRIILTENMRGEK